MLRDVISDRSIIDPESAEFRLAAENDRADIRNRSALIVFKRDSQIELHAGFCTLALLAEVVIEVFRKLPEMTVHIDD